MPGQSASKEETKTMISIQELSLVNGVTDIIPFPVHGKILKERSTVF
jgi:hypothetical protein